MTLPTLYQELLSHQELEQLCFPLVQAGAQRRFLTGRGIPFWTSPSGRPVVQRSHLNDMFSGNFAMPTAAKAQTGPNRDALLAKLSNSKKRPSKS